MMNTSYSNQDFDVAQAVATALTAEDRAGSEWTGQRVPAHGYSLENFDLARTCIKFLDGMIDYGRVLREAQNRRAELTR